MSNVIAIQTSSPARASHLVPPVESTHPHMSRPRQILFFCCEAGGGVGVTPHPLARVVWDCALSIYNTPPFLAGRVSADGPLRLDSIEPQFTFPLCRVSHVIRKIANLTAA